MTRSVILHAGLPKTATTTCQGALFAKRALLLERHGTLYPGLAANHTDALCAMFLDDPREHITVRLQGVTTKAEAEALRHKFFEAMEAEIGSAPWTTLALSAEGVSNLPRPSLARLHEWLGRFAETRRVFFWARDPVAYTTSVIQELVKGGQRLDQMRDDLPLPSLRAKVENAMAAFGEDRVAVEAFEDAAAEAGGVVAAFCRRFGLPEATALEVAAAAPRLNPSMSMLATMILDTLNRERPLFVGGSLNPQRSPDEVGIIQRISGDRFRLPRTLEEEVRLQTQDDVDWLTQRLGRPAHEARPKDPMAAPVTAPLPPETLGSLALVLSDLINGWTQARARRP